MWRRGAGISSGNCSRLPIGAEAVGSRCLDRLRSRQATSGLMKRTSRRLTWTLAVIIGALGASATAVYAQRIWAGFYGRTPPKFPTATTFDGNFHFCRVMFESDVREKQGWSTDYPGADINLSVRLAELTKVRVTMTRDSEGG